MGATEGIQLVCRLEAGLQESWCMTWGQRAGGFLPVSGSSEAFTVFTSSPKSTGAGTPGWGEPLQPLL